MEVAHSSPYMLLNDFYQFQSKRDQIQINIIQYISMNNLCIIQNEIIYKTFHKWLLPSFK